MRILLALVTLFAAFQAEAYCYLSDNVKQPQIEAEPITLDLSTASASVTENINLNDTKELSFACLDKNGKTPNQFSLLAAQNINEYYLITNGSHKLYLKIWLEPDNPATTGIFDQQYYKATTLNMLRYKLNYSVQSKFSGSTFRNAEVNSNLRLDSHIIIKPADCSINGDCISDYYNNSTHQYIYYINVIPKFTPTTCTFNNQAISAQDISYQDITNNTFAAPTTEQPKLECSSTTGVATSNIHYHFEAISTTTRNILQNELATQPGSAGEIGFVLKNNGQEIISYPSQKFTVASLGNPMQTGSEFPLDLQLRYASYGNKVFSGLVQSKVKVVVDYD